MSASIQDVARKANVSISTVSRVVNGRDVVNEETRKRVESAIHELGYSPNVFARGLMLRRSHILGLVLPDLHGDFYSEIIRGANLRARELGYRLMISSATANDDGKELIAAVTSGGLVDGLAVMISEVETRIRSTLQKVRTPLVIIDGDVEGASYDTVLVDQRIGASALVSHLIKNCRARRIVFVGGPETNIDTRHRFGAFREEIAQRDLQLRPADVIYLDYRYDSAYELGVKCVADWAAGQAAIFAANDEMAAGIIDAALAAGLKLPSDLPIVGFDDTRLASMTRPRLTTVRVPVWRMGAAAVEMLVQRIDDVDRPQETLVLPSELVVRESCGASSRTAE